MEQIYLLKILSILKIHIFGSITILECHSKFSKLLFRYPSAPVQTPPGQYHESPTEQYWNGLPNEQGITSGGVHPNANPYSANCNINNNLNSSGDYDGTRMVTDGGW